MANIEEAMLHGYGGDFQRYLAARREHTTSSLPTTKDWETLSELEKELAAPGVMASDVNSSDLIAQLPGYEFLLKGSPTFVEWGDRDDEQKQKAAKWGEKARMYLFLRRVGYTYTGGSSADNNGGGLSKRKHDEI